jgi:hypothetical protein
MELPEQAGAVSANPTGTDNVTPSMSEDRDETAMLLEFVQERDAPCPVCGYNLRNLTRPICPECRQELALTVGALKIRFEWLIVTIAPGVFSGIAGVLLLGIIFVGRSIEGSWPPWPIWVLDTFGLTSGAATIALFIFRYRFIRLRRSAQRGAALLVWTVHLLAFAVLVVEIRMNM